MLNADYKEVNKLKVKTNLKRVPILRVIFLLPILSGCAHLPNRLESEFIPSYQAGPFVLTRQLNGLVTIPVGSYPKSVSISPDDKRAYICNLEGGSVDIIDADSLELVKRIEFKRTLTPLTDGTKRLDYFEEKPVEIAFTKGGRYVWISLLKAGGVVVHDTEGKLPKGALSKKAVIQDYQTGDKESLNLKFIRTGNQPKVIAVSPDENWIFVANWKGHDIAVIDSKKMVVVKRIKTGLYPRGICFTPTAAYVANFGSHTISEIDLKSLKKKRTFRNVGASPRHLVLALDGRSIYVSNHGDKHIRQVDLASGKIIRKTQVGTEPRTICLSGNKKFLFVTNYKDDTLSVLDLDSMSPIITLGTLRRPVGASYDVRTDTLWVTGYWDKEVRVYKFQSMVVRNDKDSALREVRAMPTEPTVKKESRLSLSLR